MRRLTAAVFGTIGLLVAGATAYAIEGSTWFTTGTILIDVRPAGMPRWTAEGPFENTFTGVLSNQVFVSFDEVTFTRSVTASPTSIFPGTPTFEPLRFTQTVSRFGVDFDAPPSGIDYAGSVEGFFGNLVSEVFEVPVVFSNASVTTLTASSFQGVEVFRPTLKAGGQFKAFNSFSEIKGGFTITAKGMTFILGDTKTAGRKTKFKIRNVLQGYRNF